MANEDDFEDNSSSKQIGQKNPGDWKDRIKSSLGVVQKWAKTGAKQSENLSKVAKHQVDRSLLLRNRKKLHQELGEMAFHLMEKGDIKHTDLQRSFERIVSLNEQVRHQTQIIDQLTWELKKPQNPHNE